MFVIFGASGHTGSVVARELLERGKKVRVVTRDAARVSATAKKGAEVFVGNVRDPASVRRALEGAEGAYLLNPPDPRASSFVAESRKVIDGYGAALAAASVRHVVFLSSVAAQLASGTGPIVTVHYAEKVLPEAAPRTAFTFLRAAYFMENLLGYAQAMKGDGVLPVFGGAESYPFPMVSARDVGKAAADALLAPATNQVIELSGPREYSFVDAANEASKLLGRAVKATPLPIEGLVPALTALGLSEDVAKLYREMTIAFGRGEARFEGTHRAMRGTTPLGDVLRAGLG